LDNVIKTIVRSTRWTPHYIADLYCDDYDEFGLIYWYNDIKEQNEQLKKASKV